jgi:hypothetical protein
MADESGREGLGGDDGCHDVDKVCYVIDSNALQSPVVIVLWDERYSACYLVLLISSQTSGDIPHLGNCSPFFHTAIARICSTSGIQTIILQSAKKQCPKRRVDAYFRSTWTVS